MPKLTIGTRAGSLTLDTENVEASAKALTDYVQSEAEEAVKPVQTKLDAASADVEALKGLVVDDIVRMRTLRLGTTDKAEALTSHLNSFNVQQLQAEREMELEAFKAFKPGSVTSNADDPENPSEDDGDDFAPVAKA